jgi:hypothetical protein
VGFSTLSSRKFDILSPMRRRHNGSLELRRCSLLYSANNAFPSLRWGPVSVLFGWSVSRRTHLKSVAASDM